MKIIGQLTKITCLIMIVFIFPVNSFAAEAYYGFFKKLSFGQLVVFDKSGTESTFTVDDKTIVMSRAGGNLRLERLRYGTSLSLTFDGGRAVYITIQEVPK